MGLTWFRRADQHSAPATRPFPRRGLKTSLGSLAAGFNAQKDVSSELADQAIDRMTATDEAAEQVDHANYDPAEAALKDQDLGVALG